MNVNNRICIFLPSLDGGGAERVMATLASEFAARGFVVDLVLAKATGPYLATLNPRVNVIDMKCERVFSTLFPLARYLKASQPAAVLSAMTHTNIVAILARSIARVRTRLVISERSTISMEASKATGFAARIIYKLAPWIYRRADQIVCVSKSVESDLLAFAGLQPTLTRTIYNPFDLETIEKRSKEPIDHPWFQEDQVPVILGIGRLTEQKDFGLLIKAFAQVRNTHPSRLVILGEGPDRALLHNLAQSLALGPGDVDMPGFASNPYAYLARSKVFVLSSRWEGLPGALIEAMACGTPVISTNCPSGPDEILEAGHWGSLISVGDLDSLVAALRRAMLPASETDSPDVKVRAQDFALAKSTTAYLDSLGLPSTPRCARTDT